MNGWLWVFAVMTSLLTATPALAQDVQGDWQGVLELPNGQLHLVVHIQKGADGRYSGSLDSPDQGATGIPLAAIVADGQTLAFDAPSIRGRYRGTWDPSQSQWKGQWAQGAAMALNLRPMKHGATSPGAPIVAGLDGDWRGALQLPRGQLHLVFHIKTTSAATTATMDSPDQGAKGIPVSSITRTGDTVNLKLSAIGGAFEGRLATDGQTLVGQWTQAGQAMPLTLTRHAAGSSGPVLRRPQTPVEPYPYREEEVTYENAALHFRLAGTLTIPRGTGPFAAVVLVAGSGPNDRNETIYGHQIFKVLADHLTRNGIAVLRFDKRGVGASAGDYASATSADFAADVEAGITYLRTRSEVEARAIGLIGHSEGGLIAPMVAVRDPSVAFIVLMAGPGIPGDKILLAQTRLIAQVEGVSDARIEEIVEINRKVYAAIANARDSAEAAAAARETMRDSTQADISQSIPEGQVKAVSSNWFRFFLTYDPAPTLRQVKCPVLAINSSKDLQVPPAENLAAIRSALANNPDADVRELPGLNHLFQTANTGAPHEYSQIEETIAPSVLDLISSWISRHARQRLN